MTANPFTRAAKHQLKARIAFAGPTGSGKTYTALEWATILADGAPIAVVDTEHGSASLYADMFDFDVLTWAPPYDPGRLADTITAAEKAGYAVCVLDSMSHFWEGEGGTLDIADAAGQRSGGNSFAGWKVATPQLRHLIDVMLGCDMHVIGTMRSKMEYVLEEDSRGKKVPKKVGMAPVMRQGVEYEFTMCGDIDLEHRLLFTKSRCSALADVMVQPGRAADAAQTFRDWLQSGVPAAPRVQTVPVAEAKRELLAAVGGVRPAAKVLWGQAFGDVTEVARLELDAVIANLPADDERDEDQGRVETFSETRTRFENSPHPAGSVSERFVGDPGHASTDGDGIEATGGNIDPAEAEDVSSPDVDGTVSVTPDGGTTPLTAPEGGGAANPPRRTPTTTMSDREGDTAPPAPPRSGPPGGRRTASGKPKPTAKAKGMMFALWAKAYQPPEFPPMPPADLRSASEENERCALLQLCADLGTPGLTSRSDIDADLCGLIIDHLTETVGTAETATT